MTTSSSQSSHSRKPERGHVHKSSHAVNRTGHSLANQVVGWLVRANRLIQTGRAGTSIDAFLSRTSFPISKSMISMMENGKRPWKSDIIAKMEEVFGLKNNPLQRTYISLGGSSGLSGLDPQAAADNLEEIIGGNIKLVSSLDLVRTIQWVTSRNDPLGHRSWERIVVDYVDRTCDTKGVFSQECDQALPQLAAHPVAKKLYFDYTQELTEQHGHPKSFVPVIALQANNAFVDIADLVRQIEQPHNRWLIREHLNLAGAKLFDKQMRWSDGQIERLDKAAYEWITDSGSEVEVIRAAKDLRNCIYLRSFGKVRTTLEHLIDEPNPNQKSLKIAQKIVEITDMTSVADENFLNIFAMLIEIALSLPGQGGHDFRTVVTDKKISLRGGTDRSRSIATRILAASPFSSAICDYARTVLNNTRNFAMEQPEMRSWIRILGKLGSDVLDAKLIWKLFISPINLSLLETAAWALCDMSAVVFPVGNDKTLKMLPSKYQEIANDSISRALISAYGRAGKWSILRGIQESKNLTGKPSDEVAWWIDNRAPGL